MSEWDKQALDLSAGSEDVPVLCRSQTFPTFKYSSENLPGPGCPVDPSEVTLPGCSCLQRSCSSESCCCLQTYGQPYDSGGLLLDLHPALSSYSSPVFECNAFCSCSAACSTRVVQNGLQLRVEVFRTDNKGWGVRTLEEVKRGAFVCEYAGEVIGFSEARCRQLAQSSEENNYIIAVREYAGTGAVTETFVDPARVGNVGRFLNHSCLPNLVMVPVRVHSVIPQLALFARRDIQPQEELTFDYSGGCGNWWPTEGVHKEGGPADAQAEGLQRKECRCGAESCSRFLPLDLSVIS